MATQASSDSNLRVGSLTGSRTNAANGAADGFSVTIRTAADLNDHQFVQAWEALAAAASEPNPFYECWYLGPSMKQLGQQNDIQLLCIERDGTLFGLLPLVKLRSYYGHPLPHWRNWVHSNCFCGVPLIVAGTELWVWQAILDWCDGQGGLPLFLHLTHIPQDCAPARALADICGDGRHAVVVKSEERALLRSDQGPDEYLEGSLSTKKRKELRRQHRRLSELGELEFARQSDAAGLDHWVGLFLELETAGWKGAAQSALAAAPETAAVFAQALHGAAQRGKLERLCLSLDGKPIAMLANFLSPPGAFSFKTAYDETYSRFSPGVLLQRENLELLEHEEISWCDSCADADHPMIDKIWRERRTMLRINLALGNTPRRALFRQIARQEGGHAFTPV